MATQDFEQFKESFFGMSPQTMREGPDTDALARLQGQERDTAEQMLLSQLAHNDLRAVLGLGVLRSQKGAPQIQQMMYALEGKEAQPEAGQLLVVSEACFHIDDDDRAFANIVKVLLSSPNEVVRSNAITALRKTGLADAERALWRAVEHDESGTVRHNAAKAILMLHGKLPDPRQSPQPTIRIMMKPPHIREEALRELRALLRG